MIYDREKYDRGKMKLVTQPIIYVEGLSNKVFYQQLKELKNYLIDNGGNCTQIKKKIESQSNCYGIVDHDYLAHNHENLFPINFYSVENISLIYMKELEDLRASIHNYVKTNRLETLRFHKPHLEMYSDEKSNRVIDFNIILTNEKNHEQFNEYITNNILCGMTFMKYKDLKKIVERYVKFHKRKYGGDKINHIIDLAEHLPSKSIEEIFDETTLGKFTERLNRETFTLA